MGKINEDKIIGDLKKNFVHRNSTRQKHMKYSASEASGNISLAFYRGMAIERENIIKECINILRKDFPEASKYLKNKYK